MTDATRPPRMLTSVMSGVAVVAVVGLIVTTARSAPDPSVEEPAPVVAKEPAAPAVPAAARGAGEAPDRSSADSSSNDDGAGNGEAQGSGTVDGSPVKPGLPVSAVWAERVGGRSGIPARALASYAAATLRLGEENPGCHLGWPTLAAIGAVESAHGTHGGTLVGDDGRTGEPIVGMPLDGSAGVAAIGDTDGGRYDGDAEWDRAVGPMQFIPSTWQRWSADGNDDGVADVHNLDDAALAAGRYLCASGGDLSQGRDWRRAVLTYNRSDEYADNVLERANHYARASWG